MLALGACLTANWLGNTMVIVVSATEKDDNVHGHGL